MLQKVGHDICNHHNCALRIVMNIRNLAKELGLLQLLPNTVIHPTDALLALLATYYVVVNMYVPGTISAITVNLSLPQKGSTPRRSRCFWELSPVEYLKSLSV